MRICSAVSVPSRRAPTLTVTRIGWRVVVRDELLLPRELQLDRPAGPQRRQRDDVLDQHLLLAAEAAADALAEHPHLGRVEIEQIAQRPAGQERHLRAGADVQPPSASSQPIAQCVSRCACWTRCVT